MRTTRTSIIIAIATFAVTALGGLSARAAEAPGTGIAGTAHDFTYYNSGSDDPANHENIGLCTFCHTPHRAQTTQLLWNHTLSNETYSWNDITHTTGGTLLPTFGKDWQGVSKNCLSCHDGTVALGDVAWFNATPNYTILEHRHAEEDDAALITFNSNDGGGVNMNGNHPVAFPYPYLGTANAYNGVTNAALAVTSGWVGDPATDYGIRLFNDVGGVVTAGAVGGRTGIECSSCHDPHNGPGVPERKFLRGFMTGNDETYLCLMCHRK